ncbi:hypothetical protein PSEUDO8BK_90006 [Pseudomonas sp. 8BK]|nr:hypothetical protein PSEUDO8BK_90006 [Pseudomonas sp. 8BK]
MIADLVLVLDGGEGVVEALPFGIAGVYILSPDILQQPADLGSAKASCSIGQYAGGSLKVLRAER